MSGVITPGILGGTTSLRYECSRAGCRDEAAYALLWRNPKIHAEDRRKTWLACEPHLPTLRDFLETRGFPLEVRTIEEIDD
ncbi:hypothetical protein JOF28_000458 [Leucobacter exalbidus]|uniref:Acetone carboxylase n=1 Tax=Leucobacter exalbidus TaxID=662960 RepID=A0A940PVZ9_9MICO|nr:hypothetical protein [Leucobacter exalbidus]MBP1325226.1 hypothetical protein [Leucobacter exalbidus]